MLLNIDEQIPGVINQDFISALEQANDQAMLHPINEFQQEEGAMDPIRITIIGESVAARIGMFWKDYVSKDQPMLDYHPQISDFPLIKSITNMGQGQNTAIAYWICKSPKPKYRYEFCDHFRNKRKIEMVMNSFETSKPNIVVFHVSKCNFI